MKELNKKRKEHIDPISYIDLNIEKMIPLLNEWKFSKKLEIKSSNEVKNYLENENKLEEIQKTIKGWKTKEEINNEIISKRDFIRKDLIESYKKFIKWFEDLNIENIRKGNQEKLSPLINYLQDKEIKEEKLDTKQNLEEIVGDCLRNWNDWKEKLLNYLNQRNKEIETKSKRVVDELVKLEKMFGNYFENINEPDNFILVFLELKQKLNENDTKLEEIKKQIPIEKLNETTNLILKYYYQILRELEELVNVKQDVMKKLEKEEKSFVFKSEEEIRELEELNDKWHDSNEEIDKIKAEMKTATARKRSGFEKQIEEKEKKIKEQQNELRNITKKREEKVIILASMANESLPELKLKCDEIDLVQYLESDGLERKRTRGDYENVEEMKMEGGDLSRHKLFKAKWENEDCVLKEFSLDNTNDMKSFRKEIKNLSELKHPNIVEIECYFIEEGESLRGYIHMPFYEGGHLNVWIKNKKPSELQLQRILTQIAKGIEFIHSKDIIHCDLKPQNILITSDGNPKIGDLEISKDRERQAMTMAKSTFIGGTIDYMSPVK